MFTKLRKALNLLKSPTAEPKPSSYYWEESIDLSSTWDDSVTEIDAGNVSDFLIVYS